MISSPQPNSLENLLRSKRYKVPIYQRPYSWTRDEASELWYDLEKNKSPYFLGILVFQKTDNNKTFWVVDGQQRLATLLLLIRAGVETLGRDDPDAARIQNELINQKKIGESEAEFVLTLSERDKENFQTAIDYTIHQPTKFSPRERKLRQRPASPAKLNSVKEFFLERFSELMLKKGKEEGVLPFITKKILEVEFIEVELENDNDVFLFFETLNARGVDLTIADLLKNRVCFHIDDTASAVKKVDEITDIVGEGKMNSFLLHYCVALSEGEFPPTKKSLMTWYNDVIGEEKNNFLSSLKEYAEIYSLFINPKNARSTDLKDSLNYLKVLGATRCYPLLLVGYKFLSSSRDFLKLCKAVENLTFRHSTISGKDAKILEDEYYKLSQYIKRKDKTDPVLERLQHLAGQIPDDVFISNFRVYEPANNQVAKYILLKIDNYLNKELAIKLDWDDVTLEHILAEGADWEGKNDLVGRLGNMALLSGKLNQSVGTKNFEKKSERYKNEDRAKLTQELAKRDSFTKESIIEYQNYLADLAIKVWHVNAS